MRVLFYRTEESGLDYFSNSKDDYVDFANRNPSVFSGKTITGYHLIDTTFLPKTFETSQDFTIIEDGYDGYHSELNGEYQGYNIFIVPDMLGSLRRLAYEYADKLTALQFSNGFDFEGMTFSLSQNAQVKWSGLYNAKEMLSYPLIAPNIDDSDGYQLNSPNEVGAVYQTAVNKTRELLDAGRLLKEEIRGYTSEEEFRNFSANNLNSLLQLRFNKALK